MTTNANYCKTIPKKKKFIFGVMFPNQWDIFSLFLVHDACLRSYFKNSWLVFHRGFQTLENNKSTRPTASCFHQFSRVWKPRWNIRTRFWNITWILPFNISIFPDFSSFSHFLGLVAIQVVPRENDGTEREVQGVGRDMSCPRKLFWDERKPLF